MFVDARECLQNAFAKKKRVVINASPGGDLETALAIGMLVHEHGWDVESVFG